MKKLIILLVACFIWATSLSQKTMTSKEAFIAYLKNGEWVTTESKPLVVVFTFKDNRITVTDSAHSVYILGDQPIKKTDLLLIYQAVDELNVHCTIAFMKMIGYGVVQIAYSNLELYYIIPPVSPPPEKRRLPDIKM